VRLRKLRGQLLKRPRTGPVQVAASGRGSWVGWVELKQVAVNERTTEHRPSIHELDPAVTIVVEADDRPGLDMFCAAMLA
jgi:hypothetical protein